MGLITAMSIYEMAITRDFYFEVYKSWDALNQMWDANGFNLFYRLLIADGVLTFIPQIAGLILVYGGVSSEIAKNVRPDILSSEGTSYNRM